MVSNPQTCLSFQITCCINRSYCLQQQTLSWMWSFGRMSVLFRVFPLTCAQMWILLADLCKSPKKDVNKCQNLFCMDFPALAWRVVLYCLMRTPPPTRASRHALLGNWEGILFRGSQKTWKRGGKCTLHGSVCVLVCLTWPSLRC